MDLYSIPVRNELTGEVTTVCLASSSCNDAQIQALSQLFRERGWRKACAFQAEGIASPEAADALFAAP